MTDRAQFTTPRAVRLLISSTIALLVIVLVIEEMLSAAPPLAPGEVEQVCGLCHVDWKRQATALLIIGGLVALANWLLGGPASSTEGER